MGFSRQEYWFSIPFSSGPCFVRTLHHDPSILGGPTQHGSQFHWVRQGCGPCLLSFLWFWFSFCLPSDKEIRRDCLRGKLGLVLMSGALLSKSFIQFSVDGWSCIPSLLFTWGQTMVEVMKIMVTSFKRSSSNNKREDSTWTLPDGQHRNQTDNIFYSQRWRSSKQSAKTRLGADCGSGHEHHIPNSDLNWRSRESHLDHSGMT